MVSCQPIKEKIYVNVPVTIPEIDIYFQPTETKAHLMSRVPAETVIVYDDYIGVNIAKELDKNKYNVAELRSLTLTGASLLLVKDEFTESEVNLLDYQNMKLYVDGGETLVAKVKNVDVDQGLIELETTDVDVLGLIDQDNLHVVITGDKPVVHKVHFKLSLKFKVKVGLK